MRADVARNASPMLYGELHRYLTVVAHWLGYRVAEVSVQHHERLHGKTKYGLARFWRGFVDLLTVRFLMTYESRPSHLFSGLGLASMAAGGLALDLPVRREGLGRGHRRPAAADRGGRPGAGRTPARAVRAAGRAPGLLPTTRPRVVTATPRRRAAGDHRHVSWSRSASSCWPSPRCWPSSAPSGPASRTDEPIHVMRLRNFFDTGWYALDWDYGGAGPGGDGTNTYVYAPVTMLLLHAWSVLWGVEGWHDVATSSHAYHVRHLGVVVIGLVGVAAVAATGRVRAEDWRWGLVAAAVLAAIPMWTGHEMFNVKDVPVATGHTLCTLGLLLFVRDVPPRWPLRARAGRLSRRRSRADPRHPARACGPGSPCSSRSPWSGCSVAVATAARRRWSRSPSWRGSCALAAAALVAVLPEPLRVTRCARCPAPARPPPASWPARSRTGSTCRATLPRRCRPCFWSSR